MEARELAGLAIRIAVIYLYLLVLLRLAGKRVVAEGTPFDLVVAFVIGNMPEYVIWEKIPLAEGLAGVSTVTILHLLVVIAAHRSRRFERLVASPPRALVARGQPVRAALARERMNGAALVSLLREQQIDDLPEVELALLEPEGRLSVSRREADRPAEGRDLPALAEHLA